MTCTFCKFKSGDKVKWNGKKLFGKESYTDYYEKDSTHTIGRIANSNTYQDIYCHFIHFSEYKYNGWGCCDLMIVKKPKPNLPKWW